MAPPDNLTVAQVAERLQVNPQTVRNWIDRGDLEHVRLGPRRIRVTTQALSLFTGTDDEKRSTRTRRSRDAPPPPPRDPFDRDAVADALDQIAAGVTALAKAIRSPK